MNLSDMLKLKSAKEKFEKGHPKMAAFVGYILSHPMEENTVIEISVTEPDGKVISSNIRVTAQDLEIVNQLKELGR